MEAFRCLILLALATAAPLLRSGPAIAASNRPRLIVMTDYFKDPDDKQSMIRFLTYSNEFEIEGLITTSLAFGDGSVRPELLREQIAEYAQVYPVLRQHGRPGYEYPEPSSLDRLVKPGADVVWGGYVGYFADPDGHVWEVAWNPGFPLDSDGRMTLPD